MNVYHKAYIFDLKSFSQELAPLITAALRTGELKELRAFIRLNVGSLVDPYEGERLDDQWEQLLEYEDAHQLGDFALTKYYSPLEERGAGEVWGKYFYDYDGYAEGLPFLGRVLGAATEPFDPGKMGSYFQGPSDVSVSLGLLRASDVEMSTEDENVLEVYYELLQEALEKSLGIYVTF